MVLVATTIPMMPQMTETTAPMRNAKAVHNPCSVRKVITMNMIAIKMKQMVYSALRNSLAPSEILYPNSMSKLSCLGVSALVLIEMSPEYPPLTLMR